MKAGKITVVGIENVPSEGGIIVSPVHVSHLDPPAMGCAMERELSFMAKQELFKGLFGALIRSLNAFPVRRGEGDTEAIRKSISLLQEGRALLVFPEGTRNDGDQMLPMSAGVAMLAKKTGAKVVPVGIVGTNRSWPKGQKKITKTPITVAFGKPFTYDEVAKGQKNGRELFLDELSKRISDLCGDHGWDLKTSDRSSRSSAYVDPGTGTVSPPEQ